MPNHNGDNFKALSGAAGSGGGVGYKPLRTGMHEMSINGWWISGNAIITVTSVTASALNNYVAVPFILAESVTINRVFLRVNAVTSPVMTIRGGISTFDTSTGFPTQVSSVISFVTNASGTVNSFTAGQFMEFVFAANVTLSANTWYCVAAQVTSFTSGSLTLSSVVSGSVLSNLRFPVCKTRSGAGAETNQTGQGMFGFGFFDGSTTESYYGPGLNDGSGNLNIFTATTTLTQVGFEMDLNLPVDEIYITKIELQLAGQNTGHSVNCTIYSDIAGTKAIGTSVTIANTELVTVTNFRHREYYFCPPVRIKPYKPYYVMWAVTSGTATSTNPTFISRVGYESDNYYSFDTGNRTYYRNNSADTNFTSSPTFSTPVIIYFDTVRNTPRPQINT